MSPLFHAILSFTEVVMESLHDLSPRSLLSTESPQLSLVKQPGLNTSHGAFPVLASGLVRILFGSRIPLFYTLQGIYGVWKLCCFRFPRIWVTLMNLGQILTLRCLEISPDLSKKRWILKWIPRCFWTNCPPPSLGGYWWTGDDGTTENTAAPPQHESQWCDAHFTDLNHL